MAKFNPEIQSNPDSGINIHASRGMDSNKSLGLLFEGLGSTLNGALDSIDQSNKTNISLAAHTSVDQAAQVGLPSGPLPKGVSDGTAALGRVRAAYDQGSLSDISYHTRIATLSKQLRSQYPGYEDHVDAAVSSAMGSSTANMLREDYNKAFLASDKLVNEETKNRREYIEQNGAYLTPDSLRQYAALNGGKPFVFGDPNYNYGAMVAVLSKAKADEHTVTAKTAELNLNEASNKDAVRQTGQFLRQQVTSTIDKTFNSVTNSAFPTYNTLLNGALADGKITPEEGQTLNSQLNVLEQILKANVSSLIEDPKNPYSKLLPKQERDDALALVDQRLSAYRGALTRSDGTGILNALELDNRLRQDGLQNQIFHDKEFGGIYTYMAAMAKAGVPPEIIQDQLNNTFGPGTPMTMQDVQGKMAKKYLLAQISDPQYSGLKPYLDANGSKIKSDIPVGALKDALQLALDPATSPEAAGNILHLFASRENKDLLRKYARQDPMSFFIPLVNPAVGEKLKGTKYYNEWKQWGYDQFYAVAQKSAQEITSSQTFADNIEYAWDPGKGAFVYNVKDLNSFNPLENTKTKNGIAAVNQINSYFQAILPLAKEDGVDPTAMARVLFQGRDVQDLNKEGSLFNHLLKALEQPNEPGATRGAVPQKGSTSDFSGVGKAINTLDQSINKPTPHGATRGAAPQPKPTPIDSTKAQPIPTPVTTAPRVLNPVEGNNVPRGLRNNNPGNIEYGAYARRHGATGSDGRFAQFTTPEAGVEAMRRLLVSYQTNHGDQNLRQIISRWAPSGENDTGAYVSRVAQEAGVDPDAVVDMNDPQTAARVLHAMIRHENGQAPWAVADLEAALR